jgi:hypothetical protein
MGKRHRSSLDLSVASILQHVLSQFLPDWFIGADFIHSLMGEATECVLFISLNAVRLDDTCWTAT